MADFFEITGAIIENARTYLPIGAKKAFVQEALPHCIDTVSMQYEGQPLPDMAKESVENKQKQLLGILAAGYLNINFEPIDGTMWLMSDADYDYLSSSHILNQLERFKSNAATRNKIFDLMQDYKLTEKLLNSEVYSAVAIQNDACTRLIAMVQSQSTPEYVQGMVSQLKESLSQLGAYNLSKGGGANG